MTNKNIYMSLGSLDPELVAKAAPAEKVQKKKKNSWIKWASMAACFCIIICAAVGIPLVNHNGSTPSIITGEAKYPLYSEYGAGIDSVDQFLNPNEDSLAIVGDVPRLVIQGKEYGNYTIGLDLLANADKYVGEKIGPVKVKSYMCNMQDKTESEVEYLSADIYYLYGVDMEVAVCLKFADSGSHIVSNTTERYRICMNQEIKITSLNQFFKVYNAWEYFGLVGVSTYEVVPRDTHSSRKSFSCSKEEREDMIDMILALNGECVEITDELKIKIFTECSTQAKICYGMYSTSKRNNTLVIFDNGYFLIDVAGNTYLFSIGEKSATAIIDYIYSELD